MIPFNHGPYILLHVFIQVVQCHTLLLDIAVYRSGDLANLFRRFLKISDFLGPFFNIALHVYHLGLGYIAVLVL